MTELLLNGLRYLLTLLFGIAVSAAFLDVAPTRKNIVILSVFSALDFIVQCILFLLQSDSVTYASYPLVTHIPLVLLLTLQMPPGTFCSGGSHSVPVLSDQQLDLHHTSDIPLPRLERGHNVYHRFDHYFPIGVEVRSFTDRKASVQAGILPYFLCYRACILLYLRLCFHRIHEAAVCRELYYSRIPAVFAVYFLFDFLRDLL